MFICTLLSLFFFFNDTATTEIYTLSLHDALPISCDLGRRQESPPVYRRILAKDSKGPGSPYTRRPACVGGRNFGRSEEHTSELQSQSNLVCRLLLEKKKKKYVS